MKPLLEELIARLRWQPECIDALRTQLDRHPDVAARLRDALRTESRTPDPYEPSPVPLDRWLRH